MKATIEMKKKAKIPQKDVNIFGSRVDCVYRYEKLCAEQKKKKSWLNSCKDKLSIIEASTGSRNILTSYLKSNFSCFFLSATLPTFSPSLQITRQTYLQLTLDFSPSLHDSFFPASPHLRFFVAHIIRYSTLAVDEFLYAIFTQKRIYSGRERENILQYGKEWCCCCHSFHLHLALAPVYVCLNCAQPSNFT